MPAHVRIRVLLVIAVVVICGGVFFVTQLQRLSDEASFVEYSAVRELRGTTWQMVIALDEASARGAGAAASVRTTERAIMRAIADVRVHRHGRPAGERRLVDELAAAASGLADLAGELVTGAPGRRVQARRGALIDRFRASSRELLEILGAERRQLRRDSARRPVILVVALFMLFALVHLVLVERPASRERRARRGQGEFGEAMQVARSEDEAYDVLAGHVARVADASHVTVLNRNNSANRLEPVTPVPAGSAMERSLQGAGPDSCLAVRLARTHERTPGEVPLLSCEVCGRSPERTTCVPSLVGGEVIGAVHVVHHQSISPSRQARIEQSVAEAAPVIANLRNLAVAELRAATDGLTGLPNQRTVHETVKRAAAQAGRTTTPLALVVFDLDHFKAINDTYGHGKGDEVLAAVGAVAADTLRASDFVGRLGGEEFAAVLPDTDLPGGLESAEKLRAAIAQITVPGVDRAISASFGVAVMPDHAGEPDLLLREADRALYAAKSAGRDRVEAISTPQVG